MSGSNSGWIAVAAAVAFVGALWAGVPAGTLVIGLAVLACPLMMVFMMSGHGGHGGHGGGYDDRDRHDRSQPR